MRVATDYWRKPGPIRIFDWSAIDADTPDSGRRGQIGYGETEAEAITDLMDLLGMPADLPNGESTCAH